MTNFELIKIEVEMPAVSVENAWKAYVEDEHIVNWNFASDDWFCPKAQNDLRVGGVFNNRMEAKDGSFGFDFTGKYLEVEENKLLSFEMDDQRKVRIEFEELNGEDGKVGSKIKVSFDAEKENSIEMQKDGWQSILNNYKKYAEGLF